MQTVVDRIDHRSKVQLMKHFIWGVTAYVLATAGSHPGAPLRRPYRPSGERHC